jgi:hypothetical protein
LDSLERTLELWRYRPATAWLDAFERRKGEVMVEAEGKRRRRPRRGGGGGGG